MMTYDTVDIQWCSCILTMLCTLKYMCISIFVCVFPDRTVKASLLQLTVSIYFQISLLVILVFNCNAYMLCALTF